jgi:hypothetical protein
MPAGGTTVGELRRVLIFNAAAVAAGLVLVCLGLLRRRSHADAFVFSGLSLVLAPLRDATDYVASDPLAIAFSLMSIAILLQWESISASLSLGLAVAVFALVRPNTAASVLVIASLVFVSAPKARGRRILVLFGATGLGLAVLEAGSHVTRLPLNPLRIEASTPLLYGTADYSWPPDIGSYPEGSSPEDTARLQRDEALRRWREFLESPGYDRNRSLLWKSTHALLSAEQFPSLWDQPGYLVMSKLIHRWWWVFFLVAATASVVCAISGKGSWRLVPLAAVAVIVGQGIVFGPETRFALPLVPIVAVGLIVTLRTVRISGPMVAAAGLVLVGLVTALVKVPDAAASDYAALHVGDVLRQHLEAASFRTGDVVTVHARILPIPIEGPQAYDVMANGEVVYQRAQDDKSPHPAFVSFVLRGNALERARKDGVDLEVRLKGDSRSSSLLVYPAVPALLGASSTINGSKQLPSAFGGLTAGGVPVWTHPSLDPSIPRMKG